MVQTPKLAPDLIKFLCNIGSLNSIEKKYVDKLTATYSKFYTNNKFKHFDKFIDSTIKDEPLRNFLFLLIVCLGLSHKMFSHEYTIPVSVLADFLKVDKNPTYLVKMGVMKELYISSVDLSPSLIDKFLTASLTCELPTMPDSLRLKRVSVKYISNTRETNTSDLDVNKILLTFKRKPIFSDVSIGDETCVFEVFRYAKVDNNITFHANGYKINNLTNELELWNRVTGYFLLTVEILS